MIPLTDAEIKIVEKMLHIIETCERDYDNGVGYYEQEGGEAHFAGLCSLILNLTRSFKLVRKLYNYLPSYTGPKSPKGSVYWFSFKGFQFFSHRIKFLEHVLRQNTKNLPQKSI